MEIVIRVILDPEQVGPRAQDIANALRFKAVEVFQDFRDSTVIRHAQPIDFEISAEILE